MKKIINILVMLLVFSSLIIPMSKVEAIENPDEFLEPMNIPKFCTILQSMFS